MEGGSEVGSSALTVRYTLFLALDEVKRRVITQTLEYTKGRRIAAARILGIERRQLNRLMDKLKIQTSKQNTDPEK